MGWKRLFNGLEEHPNRAPVTPEDRALRHLLYGKKPHVYRIIYAIEEDTSTVYVMHIRPPGRHTMPKR
jgi:toxin ParE1/3/4